VPRSRSSACLLAPRRRSRRTLPLVGSITPRSGRSSSRAQCAHPSRRGWPTWLLCRRSRSLPRRGRGGFRGGSLPQRSYRSWCALSRRKRQHTSAAVHPKTGNKVAPTPALPSERSHALLYRSPSLTQPRLSPTCPGAAGHDVLLHPVQLHHPARLQGRARRDGQGRVGRGTIRHLFANKGMGNLNLPSYTPPTPYIH